MSTVRMGVATADITPDLPVWASGYANRDHRSDSVADPLHVAAMVLDAGTGRSVILSLDLVGMDFLTAEPLRRSVADAVGVEWTDVQLCCSHTHFGPAITPMRFDSTELPFFDWEEGALEKVTTATLAAVREAASSVSEAMVSDMTISAPPIAFNRRFLEPSGRVVTHFRYPDAAEGPLIEQEYDDRLTVVRFDSDGAPRAIVVHLACHPVCNADDGHYALSADYVHELRRALDARYGCPILFLQGAAGDVVPADRFGDSRLRIGRAIADSIIANERRLQIDPAPRVKVDTIPATIDLCLTLDPEESKARFDAVLDERRAAGDDASQELRDRFRYYQSAVFFDRLYGGRSVDTTISTLRLGSLTFVFLPFEILSSFALAVERLQEDVRIVAYANGYQGYLPTALEVVQGGYEGGEGSRHAAIGESERLLALILEAIEAREG